MNIELAALVILTISSLVMVLMIAFKMSLASCHWLTGLSLLSAIYCQALAFSEPAKSIALLDFSPLTILLSQLALVVVFIIFWPLQQWLAQHSTRPAQFYLLLLWSTIGALVMILANHFAIFFLGLELLSLSLIGLIAYQCPDQQGRELAIEAAVKYLILSAIGSAVILLGFALIYINGGSLHFDTIASVNSPQLLPQWLVNGAIIFTLAGMLFKLSLAPCHLWFADLLQGAPTPVAALLSTLSKLAVFAVLFKLFIVSRWIEIAFIEQVITLVAITSMLWGNILALKQQNIYRLLAYSSIAHFGYLLIILLLSEQSAIVSHEILLIYLFAYLIALSTLFSILSQLKNANTLDKLRGLFWRQPLMAISLMLMILSLAGIPLTIGFMAKFYLVLSSVENQLWLLLAALIIGSVISMFYYFNLLISLCKKHQGESENIKNKMMTPAMLINAMVAIAVVGFGIYPEPITRLIASLGIG